MIANSGGDGERLLRTPDAARLARRLVTTVCPACGHRVAVPFFDGGSQPAVAAGPVTAEDALGMAGLPLDFVRCIACGHVFNASFHCRPEAEDAPPCRIYHRGTQWVRVLRDSAAEVLRRLPPIPVVVEAVCGDGAFLDLVAKGRRGGRFIGFGPHSAPLAGGSRLEVRPEAFQPAIHLAELEPDLVITRHVLDRLADPLGYLQNLAMTASCLGQGPLVYVEVACADRALAAGRTQDFCRERRSQFTTASFCRMLDVSGARLETLGHAYNGEVVYAFARLVARGEPVCRGLAALEFFDATARARERIVTQLEALHRSGKRVALWGGAGSPASFLNTYGIDRQRFPLVVDSDPAHEGSYVAGTGQLIRRRDWLLDHPVDIVILACQWRAAEIYREIRAAGIHYEAILVAHRGELVDFERSNHPYGRPSGVAEKPPAKTHSDHPHGSIASAATAEKPPSKAHPGVLARAGAFATAMGESRPAF
jgi:hypothetical protein